MFTIVKDTMKARGHAHTSQQSNQSSRDYIHNTLENVNLPRTNIGIIVSYLASFRSFALATNSNHAQEHSKSSTTISGKGMSHCAISNPTPDTNVTYVHDCKGYKESKRTSTRFTTVFTLQIKAHVTYT